MCVCVCVPPLYNFFLPETRRTRGGEIKFFPNPKDTLSQLPFFNQLNINHLDVYYHYVCVLFMYFKTYLVIYKGRLSFKIGDTKNTIFNQ